MRKFRTYFSKSNTILYESHLNTAKNPVTEIVYGGELANSVTRYIFDLDYQPLLDRINEGYIIKENIKSHKLCLTNTIYYLPRYIGKRTHNRNVERASSFDLELFNILEDWDEGTGYDLYLKGEIPLKNLNLKPSNWFMRKNGEEWNTPGIYISGTTETITGHTETIDVQHFDNGHENLIIDVTDFINDVLFNNKKSNGLGLKYVDEIEEQKTRLLQSVGFHTKYTHTFFHPYIETEIDDRIFDDRYHFYMDKDNNLCFQLNPNLNVIPQEVKIYNHLGELYKTIPDDEIKKLSHNIFGVDINVSTTESPDSVIFVDEWEFLIDNKVQKYKDKFYLMSPEQYHSKYDGVNLTNYHFFFFGINQGEKIKRGEFRKVNLTIKELYASDGGEKMVDIEYRLYTILDGKNEIEIIPFTPTNRCRASYEFYIDTLWLIPNDYYIDVRVKNRFETQTKETLGFSVI